MADAEETVVGGHESWWKKHGLAVTLLLVAASISFLIRVLYAYQLINTCNISYCYAGGSDSFYHSRVMEWIIGTHSNLVHDPLLNYPVGAQNPREPLFDWMNAILGILLAPFFGGDAVRAGMWVLEMQPAVWAALGVFPVYLIGKEVSSKRVGLLAALLYPFVVGNIQSTVATYANYLSFYTFFVLLTSYAFLRAIRLSGTRRWVESYRSPRAIWAGVKAFVRGEEHAVKWSVFAGVCLGATMFAWQGYTYVITVIMVYLALLVLIERVRKHDSFGAYLTTLLAGTIGFLMAMPYYFAQGEFGYWFTVPLLLFFGGLLVLLPFLLLRDQPWVISVPVFVLSLVGAGAALYVYNPYYFQSVLTGQGYFVKNLIFSTVAEAQAPSFDALIVSYGIGTFLLTFVGLALFIAYLFVYRFRREHLFMVILGLLGIYLPISAAKFFLLGSPIFVLLPAEVLIIALDRVGGYPQLRRNLSSLSERGGRLLALRRSFKARHLILGILVVLVVLPNVSWAVDAGIPYNVQGQYSQQIYASLPSVLQTSPSNASSFYLGIAGIETDTPQQYDQSGYSWLSTQDTFEPEAQRPAFVSWWDYGFQAIDQGHHPSVADNFQNGIDPAGNFLLAQNESLGISYMATDLLEALAKDPGAAPQCQIGNLYGQLRADGVNTTQLQSLLLNTSRDVGLVANNPGFYGPKDNSHLDALNAMYDAVSYFLASSVNENRVVQAYQDLQSCTGWSIRYAMGDTRLFPTSGSNTGIFYAPVDLTDGVIGSGGIPTYYFTVTVTGSDGQTYQLGQVPAGVQSVSSQINYKPAFYQSMLYKIEIGYNGSQVGAGQGVPGVTLQGNNPEPGWMMQHFVMGYRTAYYCPYKDYQAHPNCFAAVNEDVAAAHQKANQGTADLSPSSYFSSGGETVLEYYPGAQVQGTVTLPDGSPVPGIRLTVDDSWGTPHMTTVTDAHGQFQLTAPPGNDTFTASYGALTPLTQVGATQVSQLNLTVPTSQGFGYDTTPITPHIVLRPGSIQGSVYWNTANQTTFQTRDTVIPGATVGISNGLGTTETATSDASGTFSFPSLAPGAYNVSVSVGSFTLPEATVNLLNGGTSVDSLGVHLTEIHGTVRNQTRQGVVGAQVTLTGPDGPTTTFTTTGGNFTFRPVVPGNYSLVASDAYGRRSLPNHPSIVSFQTNLTENLTLTTPVQVDLQVLLRGDPVPGVPVRFSSLDASGAGSSVFLAGSDGYVHATISAGNWSVYALGVVNGTYVAGMGDLRETSASAEVFSAGSVLALAPAQPLEGHAYVTGGSPGPTSGVSVTVQNAQGAEVATVTGTGGSYLLWVPEGAYTILSNYSKTGVTGAGLTAAVVSGPTTTDLTLSPSFPYHAKVGYETNGVFHPLAFVPVSLTLDAASATQQLLSSSDGNLSVNLPISTSTFSLQASEYGFSPFAVSGVPQSDLNALYSQIALNISRVPVQVVVHNASAGSSTPALNFTALSSGAVALNTTGTNVTVDLYPGTYGVSAWAPLLPYGSLHPFSNSTLTVPIGSKGLVLNLTMGTSVRYHFNTTTLGLALDKTYAVLSCPGGTFATNGSTLRQGFEAAPGTCNLWLSTENGSAPYAFFDPLTLHADGTTSLPNATLLPAGKLDFSMKASFGQVLNTTLSLRFSNGNGTWANVTTSSAGNATLLLPRGGYTFSLNTTLLLDVGGVTQFWSVETNSSADTCAVAASGSSTCVLVPKVTRAYDTVVPSLLINGAPASGGSGTITADPAAGGTPIVFPILGGAASLSLLPGRYTLYTVLSSTAAPEVNITTLSVGYSSSVIPLALNLASGWVQTLGIATPSGVPAPTPVTLTFAHVGGPNVTLANLSVGSYPLVLPSGPFQVTARGSIAPYGANVELLGAVNVTVAAANAFVPLTLNPQWTRAASITRVGEGTPTVADGSTVYYQVVVNDTGNAPMAVRMSGTPSTWTIRFFPGNFTLGPAVNNRSQAVDVAVTVPAGTSSSPSPVTLQVLLQSGGTSLASVNVPLNIVAVYGISMGPTTAQNSIKAGVVVLGFHLASTGNSQEQVTLSVANGAELQQDGWTYDIASATSGAPIVAPEPVSPSGAAVEAEVQLFPHGLLPIMPNSVDVMGVDLSNPQARAFAVLPTFSHATLSFNATPVVTGPSVGGSPPPDYQNWLFPLLTVLPGLAIVAIAGTWRWWRTRRWVRR
ncbi:MAG: carboxypeptidase regulatory-like domain-containing protein [Euryarchaeota archaeon]|nr:carboxypeptidase regulatory-like domain-containing protein [Euryarchaeota archaeon]